jgi:hypothetical protein
VRQMVEWFGVGLLLLAGLPWSLGFLSGGPREDCVREARALFNTAIAERDTAAFRTFMVEDVHVTTGAGDLLDHREAYQATIMGHATDPRFVAFVRTPEMVSVSRSHSLAAESGTWVGQWKAPSAQLGGVYLAMWKLDDAGCRIRSELFVTLECSGDRCPLPSPLSDLAPGGRPEPDLRRE